MPLKRIALFLLGLVALLPSTPLWAKVPAWTLAPWENPAPRFNDLGLSPVELARAVDRRLMVFAHPVRDITIPGAKGPRHFTGARFVSSVSRVDLPVQTLRRRMQDFTDYRTLFPMLSQSDVLALDGRHVVARYRLEIPLPALANIAIDVRIKHKLEEDGSISALLIDGKAESLLAMLGGVSDELADQPVVVRWEFIPLNAQQSLLVMTYWDRVQLKSFFARKIMQDYPELDTVRPYVVAAGASEAIHRMFLAPLRERRDLPPPGRVSLGALNDWVEKFSPHGPVAIIEPELAPVAEGKAPLRYATVAYRVNAAPSESRALATHYQRLMEPHKELKKVTVKPRETGADLLLDIRIAILVIRFGLELDVATTWDSADRLSFRRTAGQLARLWGASEWHPVEEGRQTLMMVSAGHELGDEAPFILRMAHRITERIPYADTLGMMVVQMVAMERMQSWVAQQASR